MAWEIPRLFFCLNATLLQIDPFFGPKCNNVAFAGFFTQYQFIIKTESPSSGELGT